MAGQNRCSHSHPDHDETDELSDRCEQVHFVHSIVYFLL